MTDTAEPATTKRPPNPQRGSLINAATSVAALLVAVGTLLGACLYLVGHVAHITLLRALGVPNDLFTHGVEWTMINGYYAVFFEGVRTLENMPWGLIAVAGLLLAFAIWLNRLPAPKKRPWSLDWLPAWLKNILAALLTSALFTIAGLYLLSIVLLIAVIPALVGERAGHHSAQEALAKFSSTKPADAPAEIWRQGELIMRGHIIAVSAELIAFYDSQSHYVRIIDRRDVELRTRLRSPASSAQ